MYSIIDDVREFLVENIAKASFTPSPDGSFFLNYLALKFAFNRNFIFIYLSLSRFTSSHVIYIHLKQGSRKYTTFFCLHKYYKKMMRKKYMKMFSFYASCSCHLLNSRNSQNILDDCEKISSLLFFIIYFRVIYTITLGLMCATEVNSIFNILYTFSIFLLTHFI